MKNKSKLLIALLLIAAVLVLVGAFFRQNEGGVDPADDIIHFDTFAEEAADSDGDGDIADPAPDTEAATEAPETEAPETEAPETEAPETKAPETEAVLDEDGIYTTKEDVALYLYIYGRLPGNFIKKAEAEKLGWEGGGLDRYAKNKCIGGDRFGNYEGILPEKKGRTYTECDIDTLGAKSRGAKRIVFSNDGLIYYTEDHYETFELLYGEE